MKRTSVLTVAVALSVAACESMNRPINSGDFDPLNAPGGNNNLSRSIGPAFTAGQFVNSILDNTTFFKKRPQGNADADKLLPRGTSMKVISCHDSYVKVELDSGEVGYVPAVMLEDPNAVLTAPAVNPNEFQVYPPPGGVEPPLPTVRPDEKPPEGAIPTVIDPDAPASSGPAKHPAPLPPNGQE